MVEQGIVSDVKDGKLIVNIKRHPACGGCRACSMAGDKVMTLELENAIGARKGDRINIELDDFAILKGAFLFYIVPLLGLIFGISIGGIATKIIDLGLPDEVVSALFGIIIMVITFMAVRGYSLKEKAKFKLKISKA